jgi:hypothetical protein
MRTLLLAFLAASLGVASAFLVACGDRNDLIPSSDASAVESDLDQASVACEGNNRAAALAAVDRARARAGNLPSEVDVDLRKTLGENLGVVRERVAADCQRTQTTQSTQTTATTPTTVTTPTTSETTPTTTTTAPPTTTTTAPPTTQTTTDTGSSGGTPPGQESSNRGKGKKGATGG